MWGRTELTRNNFDAALNAQVTKIKQAYEAARVAATQSLESLTPVDTGALRSSNRAEIIAEGIGFMLSSYGDEASAKAYARWVNDGHHTSSGSWVPPNPYFSQAVADANAALKENL